MLLYPQNFDSQALLELYHLSHSPDVDSCLRLMPFNWNLPVGPEVSYGHRQGHRLTIASEA